MADRYISPAEEQLAADLEQAMKRAMLAGVSPGAALSCAASMIGYSLANGCPSLGQLNHGLALTQQMIAETAAQVWREQHPAGLETVAGHA